MLFKTPLEKTEFQDLAQHNPKLMGIVQSLDFFCQLSFGKQITLTEVFRTQIEHDQLYSQTPVGLRPITSPHCSWQAVDVRSSDFSDPQIQRMLQFLNCYVNSNGKPVALYHKISGGAYHFHIAYFL